MSLPAVCSLNEVIVPNTNAGLNYVIRRDEFCVPINDSQCKKKLTISQRPVTQGEKNKAHFLKIDTMRKMIRRFLTEKKMSEKELAKVLEVKVKSLKRIFTQDDLSRLVPKINLPLIKLYCETKFNDRFD